MFQCTSNSKKSETIGIDWKIEKGDTRVGEVEREYRCPWNRKGARPMNRIIKDEMR